jgi:hypothetical protein
MNNRLLRPFKKMVVALAYDFILRTGTGERLRTQGGLLLRTIQNVN